MSLKRLHSRIKGFQNNSFDDIVNAFEANEDALNPVFTPTISCPESDYSTDIVRIKKVDAKLGYTFERLNQHQRHAVFFPAKNAILSAMVGSGKTTVLIAKLFYLHFIEKIPFSRMVVLTFTNKAAREIKERIAHFLGESSPEMNEQLRYFGTFHAVARQLLQEHPRLNSLGFKPHFMIMDEQEKQEFLQRLIAQENLNIKYQNQLARRWRNYLQNGELMMGNMKNEDDFAQLVTLADKEKRSINSMDFDDLITLCNQLLNAHETKTPQWIIVDEFQDCNEEQLKLIEHLRREKTQLFVVGDQNQSIYGWRGSKEHIFQEIQQKWDATWMELPQNYRSTEAILSAAETLLNKKEGALIATRQSGTPIELVRHFDDQQEAYYLREQLVSLQKEQVDLNTVAILFRTHQQIKIVETVLLQASIPHQLVKRTELHDDVAQSFLLRILKLCINHNDVDACLSLICDPTFGAMIQSKTLLQILHKRPSDTTALKVICQYLKQRKAPPLDHVQLLENVERFKKEFLSNTNASVHDMIAFLGLKVLLKPTSIHHVEYMKSITEAWNEIMLYVKEKGWGANESIFNVAVDQVVLEGTFQINDRIKEKGYGVHLLTIHASKGLEFDRVYIAGANTGIIPLTQYKNRSQNVKEEKRLLFVAMTRGKNNVEIGWHAQPTLRNAEAEPSYFLNAISENLLKRRISLEAEEQKEAELHEEWQVGMIVNHKKYGKGKITMVDEKELICDFVAFGEKSFSKAFAKVLLEKKE